MQPLKVRTAVPSGSLRTNGTRLQYAINEASTNRISFYEPSLVRDCLKLILNRDHSFYKKVYEPLLRSEQAEKKLALEHLQLMLLAVGRAECALGKKQEKETLKHLREVWSNTLTAFLD